MHLASGHEQAVVIIYIYYFSLWRTNTTKRNHVTQLETLASIAKNRERNQLDATVMDEDGAIAKALIVFVPH